MWVHGTLTLAPCAEVSARPPAVETRGIVVAGATYGDLDRPARCADVTDALTHLLESQQSFGLGRRFYLSIPKGSKNALPGFTDPAPGVDKKLRVELFVDGNPVEHTLGEYAPLAVASQFYLEGDKRDRLQKTTYFEEEELQMLYEGFLAAAWPHKELSSQQFVDLFPQFGDAKVLVSLFSCMDADTNTSVDFAEYCRALSIIARGSLDEKIDLAFSILDLDKNGLVERDEVMLTAQHMSETMVRLGYDEESFGQAEALVNLLFQRSRASTLSSSRQDLDGKGKAVSRAKDHKAKTAPRLWGVLGITTSSSQEPLPAADGAGLATSALGAALEVQGEELEEDTTEIEEKDDATLYWNALNREMFKERARNEPDLAQCFGMFDFFRDEILSPIQNLLGETKEMEISGWLDKDKGDGALYQAVSLLTSDRRWFVIQNGFLSYHKSNKELDKPLNVIALRSASVRAGPSPANWFMLQTPSFCRHLFAETRDDMKRWVNIIRNNIKNENRFKSFAPIREGINTRWFINAAPYFEALLEVLPLAKRSVYIADWYFAPGLYLRRGAQLDPAHRVDNLLKAVAERGVQVYIIAWNAPQFAGFALESRYVTDYMNAMHPNIHAIRHPNFTPITWSHHQKFVVVDEEVAFVGGVDLCYNRYDDSRYLLADHDSSVFPGRDYGNLNFAGEANGKPTEHVLDRSTTPRMPWHDIHMMVDGPAARDVAWNFIERWNHALRNGSGAQLKKPLHMLPHHRDEGATSPAASPSPPGSGSGSRLTSFVNAHSPFSFHSTSPVPSLRASSSPLSSLRFSASSSSPPAERAAEVLPVRKHVEALMAAGRDDTATNCRCQVIRSVSNWSAGCPEPEQSIYKAYLTAIKRAKHFIYIENQYFISSINRIRPKNRIADALYQRLRIAMKNDEDFRVVVVLPVFPAGDLLSATTRYIIKYVYKAVSRQKNSIIEKLEEEFPDKRTSDYISFYSLRTWGRLQPEGGPVTEQVYIHAKLMIVDDRVAIIGSANINDRSMRGTRDSEIGVLLEPEEADLIPSTMGGKPVLVGKFAHSLRTRLWAEYLGAVGDSPEAVKVREQLRDPVVHETYTSVWRAAALSNTRIFTKLFPGLPDTVYTLADLKKAQQLIEASRTAAPSQRLEQWHLKMLDDLQGVRGFLVEFPLLFLKDEQMSPAIWHKEYILPRNVFL